MFLLPHYSAHRLFTCECQLHSKHRKRICYAVRALVIGHTIGLLAMLGALIWIAVGMANIL